MAVKIIFVLLLAFLLTVTAKPGAKPLAKSDPGHLVHDFYKCTSPVYRLSPECQQPAPQFATGRIFSESQHFVEGGGNQNPHQVGQNNWPSYGSGNHGERKNERMVMPGAAAAAGAAGEEEEEESSMRRFGEDVQTTTSPVVNTSYTVEEEESITVDTIGFGDITQQNQKDLVQQSYQRVQQGESSRVYDETSTENQDSTQQEDLDVYDIEDDTEEDNVHQLFMDTRNKTAAVLTASQEQESIVFPSASYQTILLTPSIAHLPLENQEVTLTTQGQLPRVEVNNRVQDLGASQIHTSHVANPPLMLEQNTSQVLEMEEQMMDLPGQAVPEKDFAEEESPSVYDPIILMLQRP